MPWKHNEKIIQIGKAWVSDNGTKYPMQWNNLTNDEKKSAGLVWSEPPASETPYDNRFYYGRKDNGDLIEKSLTDTLWVDDDGKAMNDPITGKQGVTTGLKNEWKDKTKKYAHGLLVKTDWYVTRKAESSTAIPSDIATYRADVRTATKTIEDKIDSCDTLAKFIALFDAPSSGENAPIYDFPNEVS